MSVFSLQNQYELYLQRVGLTEATMHPQQKIQVREAFFGACGQLLVLFLEELPKLEEQEAISVFDGLLNQVALEFIGKKP